LAIDVGTSAVRCFIADVEGRPVAVSRREWRYLTVPEAGMLAREFVPDALWQLIVDVTGEALHRAAISAGEVVGLSAASQREGMVFLDGAGKELYAGPNIDLRAVTEGISIDNEYGRDIYAITGHLPSLMFAPARLKWFEKNRPELFKKIASVLSIGDWIIYKLTGVMRSEVCSAAEIGLVDIRTRTWSGRLVGLLGLPRRIYPDLAAAGSLVGGTSKEAAAALGIPAGTPVALGAPDTHCGLLGMGVNLTGGVGVVAGWSIPVQMVTPAALLDTAGRVWTGCYVFPDKWILESNSGEAGHALSWLMETMYSPEGVTAPMAYDMMDREIQAVPPGAEGVVASIGPGIMDMSRLGMGLGGFLFPLPLSVSDLHRGHLARAVLENICFAVKANLLQLESISGFKAKMVSVGGNIASHRAFRHLLSAVLGREIQFADVREISALGAAMLAAAGSGVYSNVAGAMVAMRSGLAVEEPDALAAAEYAEHYQRWLTALEKLRETKEALD
jgi:autoinducer 2 (AI-2) kinase